MDIITITPGTNFFRKAIYTGDIMRESYIVYKKKTSNKLYETDTLESAAAFIEETERLKRAAGDFECEKYEIVRVVKN